MLFQTRDGAISKREMFRKDVNDNVIEIVHNTGTDRFLMARKTLDSNDISIKVMISYCNSLLLHAKCTLWCGTRIASLPLPMYVVKCN